MTLLFGRARFRGSMVVLGSVLARRVIGLATKAQLWNFVLTRLTASHYNSIGRNTAENKSERVAVVWS